MPGNQKLQNRLAVSNYAKPSSKYGVANYAKPERLVNPLAWRVNKYGVSSRGQRPSYIDTAPDAVKGALSKAVGFMPSRKVVGGYIGSIIGAVAGYRISSNAAEKALYNGYVKRGEGSLKGAKVSLVYEKAYKSKFNDYYKKYSQKKPTYDYDRRGQYTYRKWQPQSAYAGN